MLTMIRPLRGLYDHKPVKKSEPNKVVATFEADKLLTSKTAVEALKTIKQYAHIPHDSYLALCEPLTHAVAEYLQKIPYFIKYKDKRLQSFLSVALVRSANSLKIYHEKEAANTRYTKKHHHAQNALFNYALFSAALLVNIGKVFSIYRIAITDENGSLQSMWVPFSGSLKENAAFYKVQKQISPDPILPNYLTALIAQNLMPKAGLDWIASDEEILKMWLAILHGEEAYSGTLGHIISLSEQKIASLEDIELQTEEELEEVLVEDEENENSESHDKALEDFKKWLEDKIDAGDDLSEKVNVSEKELVVTKDLIKEFYGQFPLHKGWAVAFTIKHNYLGIAPLSGESDPVFNKLFSKAKRIKVSTADNLKQVLPSTHDINQSNKMTAHFTTKK